MFISKNKQTQREFANKFDNLLENNKLIDNNLIDSFDYNDGSWENDNYQYSPLLKHIREKNINYTPSDYILTSMYPLNNNGGSYYTHCPQNTKNNEKKRQKHRNRIVITPEKIDFKSLYSLHLIKERCEYFIDFEKSRLCYKKYFEYDTICLVIDGLNLFKDYTRTINKIPKKDCVFLFGYLLPGICHKIKRLLSMGRNVKLELNFVFKWSIQIKDYCEIIHKSFKEMDIECSIYYPHLPEYRYKECADDFSVLLLTDHFKNKYKNQNTLVRYVTFDCYDKGEDEQIKRDFQDGKLPNDFIRIFDFSQSRHIKRDNVRVR